MTRTASTCRTVTGTVEPSSLKSRVMPSFCATRPVRPLVAMIGASDLDLDIHAGGEVELHQRVHGLRCGVDDIEQPPMRPDFELLAALLVHMRRAVDGEPADLRWQGNRAA